MLEKNALFLLLNIVQLVSLLGNLEWKLTNLNWNVG